MNKENIKTYRNKFRAKTRAFLQKIKDEIGCADCGTHKGVLVFHHLNSETKSFEMGEAVDRTEEKMIAELEKCIILCSSCHSILHNTGSVHTLEHDAKISKALKGKKKTPEHIANMSKAQLLRRKQEVS